MQAPPSTRRILPVTQTIPLGRVGEPSDVGRAAVYLASDDAAWVTGKILRVDGGACM